MVELNVNALRVMINDYNCLDPGKPERLSYDGKPCPKITCQDGKKLIETEIETFDGCPYYKCLASEESEDCSKPSCPPGYHAVRLNDRAARLQIDDTHTRSKRYILSEEQCPRYECVLDPTLTTHSRNLLTSPALVDSTTVSVNYPTNNLFTTTTTTPDRSNTKETSTLSSSSQNRRTSKCTLEGSTLKTFDQVNFVYDICYAEVFKDNFQNLEIKCKYEFLSF